MITYDIIDIFCHRSNDVPSCVTFVTLGFRRYRAQKCRKTFGVDTPRRTEIVTKHYTT